MRRYCLTIEPRAPESCSPPEGKARRYRVSSSARIQRIGSAVPGRSIRTARPSSRSSSSSRSTGPNSSVVDRSPSARSVSAISSAVRGASPRRRRRPSTRPSAWGSSSRAPPGAQQQGVQQVLVNGRSPRPQVSPPRLVPLVEIARRELKDQLGGKRRGDLALPGDDPHRPRADRLEQPAQASQLQVLIEAFAKGLDDDREIGKLAHDLEQVLRPQPLQPERGPLGGIRPGHE